MAIRRTKNFRTCYTSPQMERVHLMRNSGLIYTTISIVNKEEIDELIELLLETKRVMAIDAIPN